MTVTYRALIEVSPLQAIDTTQLFKAESESRPSAVDAFIQNTNKLNKIYLTFAVDPSKWMPEIGSLILQGYMSAVESYFRAAVTALINVDEICRKKVEAKPLSFALARSQKKAHLLPEALLEHITFSTGGSIEKVLGEFLGINNLPPDVKAVLATYKDVCQLRHCCVHRFGKLGSQNAMELGFDRHAQVIELPFSPSIDDTEKIADLLQVVVKTMNNFLFREILDRTVAVGLKGEQSWSWTWDYRKDRKRFSTYRSIFANSVVKPMTPEAKDLFSSFKTEHAAAVAGWKKKGDAVKGPR